MFAEGEAPVVQSANVVGYQNAGFVNAKFNLAANTFLGVGKTRAQMTLGDLVPNAAFKNSLIQFKSSTGSTPKWECPEYGMLDAVFTYVRGGEDGDGWYFQDDEETLYNQNGRTLSRGTGFMVNRAGKETDATLTYSGEVDPDPIELSFPESKFNLTGNCTPKQITFGDLVPNATFKNSLIQFVSDTGSTPKWECPEYGMLDAVFTYVRGGEDGDGWYFQDDEETLYNQNGRILEAGQGFMVNRAGKETDATLTLESALD